VHEGPRGAALLMQALPGMSEGSTRPHDISPGLGATVTCAPLGSDPSCIQPATHNCARHDPDDMESTAELHQAYPGDLQSWMQALNGLSLRNLGNIQHMIHEEHVLDACKRVVEKGREGDCAWHRLLEVPPQERLELPETRVCHLSV
jgi:hypothetical protein